MGARLTFGLMILAAATLAAGYLTKTEWVIYLSIVCSLIAVAGLLLSSKRRRAPDTEAADANSWTSSLAEPAVTVSTPAVVARGGRSSREQASFSEPDDDLDEVSEPDRFGGDEGVTVVPSGRAAIRRRTVTSTAAEPSGVSRTTARGPSARFAPEPEPESDEYQEDDESLSAAAVAPSRAPKRNPVASEWLAAPTASARTPAPAPARSTGVARPPAPARSGAAAGARRTPARAPAPPAADYFPIEDYDELDPEDILPLLPHLYDEELVEVFLHERDGAHRQVILDRLDVLLEGDG